MKFVPRGQTFRGVELHPLDPRQEPLQGRKPVFAISVIVECFDDQSHTLGLTQPRFLLGFENTEPFRQALCHWISSRGSTHQVPGESAALWPLLRCYHGQTALMNLPRLYPILDTASLAGRGVSLETAAAAFLEGGAGILQIRHKGHWGRDVFESARQVAHLCREAGAPGGALPRQRPDREAHGLPDRPRRRHPLRPPRHAEARRSAGVRALWSGQATACPALRGVTLFHSASWKGKIKCH
jgi:hypothetical protein